MFNCTDVFKKITNITNFRLLVNKFQLYEVLFKIVQCTNTYCMNVLKITSLCTLSK